MKVEAMLEVGDAEVVLHQEEARHQGVGLLPGEVLHLGEDLLLGVGHHHEEVSIQTLKSDRAYYNACSPGSPPRRGGGFDDGGGSWRSGPRGGDERGPPRRGSPPR